MSDNFAVLYQHHPNDTRHANQGSQWIEQHWRILGARRILWRHFPHAAPAARLLLGDEALQQVISVVPDHLGMTDTIEQAVDAAFRGLVIDGAANAQPGSDQHLVRELTRLDDALGGRIPAGDDTFSLIFGVNVLSFLDTLKHYVNSHAPAEMLRDVKPVPERTEVQVQTVEGGRRASLVSTGR